MKKKLKLLFTDFWAGFDPTKNLFVKLLGVHYDIEISNDPDLLFYSVYDFNHIHYDCPKIYYTAENTRPNYRECDFSITFDYDSYKGRNLRLPLYRWRGDLNELCKKKDVDAIIRQKQKFACMVVSNGNCKERNRFFKLLNEYKKVDSGGRFLNNIGGPTEDKMEFIRDYKFVLSFENSCYSGYTTEKIVEPMLENSIPLYWGNANIDRDFNPASFINIHAYPSMEEAIEEIIRIDNDHALFARYLEAPYFKDNIFPRELEYSYLQERLRKLTEEALSKRPVSAAPHYRSLALLNKVKKKTLSRIYGRPHFYF